MGGPTGMLLSRGAERLEGHRRAGGGWRPSEKGDLIRAPREGEREADGWGGGGEPRWAEVEGAGFSCGVRS